MDIQELVVKNFDQQSWKIEGIIGINEPILISGLLTRLPASKNTITIVKNILSHGHEIFISKSNQKHEILPNDLIIKETDDLQRIKNTAIYDIENLIYQNSFSISIIDAFEYLNTYMKLLANGICITDQNREDKYFEIIEAAQTIEKPNPPTNDLSFDEEQKYFDSVSKYETAQNNLNTLEKYLNNYDKLSRISYINSLLSNTKSAILEAKSKDEIIKIINDYKTKIK